LDNIQAVGQAISRYIAAVELADRDISARELSKFGHWLGMDTPVNRITTEQVFRYQEEFAASKADANQRLAPVKAFLASLHKQKATEVNLGASIRVRRAYVRRAPTRFRDRPPEPILITEEGHARLTAELKDLDERVRPEVTEQLRSAAADKDFSENAPYSAAKHKLSEVRTRINRIRRTLNAASIQVGDSTDVVELGVVVTLRNLIEDEPVEYQIVGAGEPLGHGGVSVKSPVGRAVLEKRVGDVVEVETPMGLHRYRIEKIERR